jgi:predicted esterase
MQAHQIAVTRTAHYCTLGEAGPETEYWIMACHGYGQLAKNFIRKFESIQQDNLFVLAPEGLSRFYWKDFTGDVGASWMTREDRLDEIADFCNMLQQLYTAYRAKMPNAKLILFGFSQGCATQMRWAMRDFPDFDRMVMWAGAIPDDLNYHQEPGFWTNRPIDFICGDKDHFLTPEMVEKHRKLLEFKQLKVNETWFEGGHEVDREVLKTWFAGL